ncbi:MAG TPA: ATPase, partial [Acetobacteraceae bacterium]|nr:ATPase [Acetobacteraceae bacterium]
TGPIVETTAKELAHDLGAGLASPPVALVPAVATSANDGLVRRIETLEAGMARQDRVFRRLMDLLSAMADQ